MRACVCVFYFPAVTNSIIMTDFAPDAYLHQQIMASFGALQMYMMMMMTMMMMRRRRRRRRKKRRIRTVLRPNTRLTKHDLPTLCVLSKKCLVSQYLLKNKKKTLNTHNVARTLEKRNPGRTSVKQNVRLLAPRCKHSNLRSSSANDMLG